MATKTPSPPFRKLRGYAIDPSSSIRLSTMQLNEIEYQIPWESLEKKFTDHDRNEPHYDPNATYPCGEYIEIVDYDPASGKFYEPVNLDDPNLLAQNGLAPSVSNPEFHQQMVYAVIMTTIKNFEKALGRKIIWNENLRYLPLREGEDQRKVKSDFVPRLRVYPHALRQANAFYDPIKKALLFGYFSASPANPQLQLPGGTVFTCLSHDIIAHETTHAILDGLHRRYIEATHPDTRAFHEAFADIVALFQHFSFPEVLKHQIAKTRGDLFQKNLLGQLAQQFGQAIGGYGSLRDAIGQEDEEGNWQPHQPDSNEYNTIMSFHARGGILVAAVFDAFLNVYQTRSSRTLRIATSGTGVLPNGELHPDLVDELAIIASSTAFNFLRICIRALDYCPPMDITFGEYLRAIVTADSDQVVDDEYGYRVAFIEAFQKRGISASGIKSMAVESLLHELHPSRLSDHHEAALVEFFRTIKESLGYLTDRSKLYEETKKSIGGSGGLHSRIEHKFIASDNANEFSRLSGLMFPGDQDATEALGLEYAFLTTQTASYAVGNVWLANRATPNGNIVNHIIVTLIQKRGVRFKFENGNWIIDEDNYFVPDTTEKKDWGDHYIIFRGGCTMIFDLDTLKLRYSIKKDIDDKRRMLRQFQYEQGMLDEVDQTYFNQNTMTALSGPFAFMHSHVENL